MVNTTIKIGELILKNPVLVASGTFGYGDECKDYINLNKLGGIITKSLTFHPRVGNPPPRIVETASGMLNSIGLANIGINKFINDKLPSLTNLLTAVIVNVAGSSIEEYYEVVSMLDDHEGIHGYEINVSCPNVKEGGLSFGTSCEATGEITKRVRKATRKALIVKLTPNITRISDIAKVVEDEGADAVSVMNTVVGMAVDVMTYKPKLSTITGGLSGPAVKPIALAKVYEVAKVVKVPIIGIGGILSTEDAIEFILVGASAIQVGTANFIDPDISINIVDGIQKYCEDNNIDSVSRLVGALKV